MKDFLLKKILKKNIKSYTKIRNNILPHQRATKQVKEIFQYLKQLFFVFPGVKINESDLLLEIAIQNDSIESLKDLIETQEANPFIGLLEIDRLRHENNIINDKILKYLLEKADLSKLNIVNAINILEILEDFLQDEHLNLLLENLNIQSSQPEKQYNIYKILLDTERKVSFRLLIQNPDELSRFKKMVFQENFKQLYEDEVFTKNVQSLEEFQQDAEIWPIINKNNHFLKDKNVYLSEITPETIIPTVADGASYRSKATKGSQIILS